MAIIDIIILQQQKIVLNIEPISAVMQFRKIQREQITKYAFKLPEKVYLKNFNSFPYKLDFRT